MTGFAGLNAEFRALVERAKAHVMTPEEKFEQRVSFVFGQQDYDNPNRRTKDEIRAMLIESMGRPACPECAKRAIAETCSPTPITGDQADD